MTWMHPETRARCQRLRSRLRRGLVCCLTLLLLAPLPSVANFALANLALQCEEHSTEKAGSEHETPHWTHSVRRQWLPVHRSGQPGQSVPERVPGDGAGLRPNAGDHHLRAIARPCSGAGVRARC